MKRKKVVRRGKYRRHSFGRMSGITDAMLGAPGSLRTATELHGPESPPAPNLNLRESLENGHQMAMNLVHRIEALLGRVTGSPSAVEKGNDSKVYGHQNISAMTNVALLHGHQLMEEFETKLG